MVIEKEMIKLVENLDDKKPNIINNIHSKGFKRDLISYVFSLGFYSRTL